MIIVCAWLKGLFLNKPNAGSVMFIISLTKKSKNKELN